MPIPLIHADRIPDHLLSSLESRDLVLWIRSLPFGEVDLGSLVAFLGLPWKMVYSEVSDPGLIAEIEARSNLNQSMTRKRGFLRVIDEDPSRIQFPQRCLPFYLLNGRNPDATQGYAAKFRKMAMVQTLPLSGVGHLLVLSGREDPLPEGIQDIWSEGFRSFLTICLDDQEKEGLLKEWIEGNPDTRPVALLTQPSGLLITELLERYNSTYPEDRTILRVRNRSGSFDLIDVTATDEPERPLLDFYQWIEEKDLRPVSYTHLTLPTIYSV